MLPRIAVTVVALAFTSACAVYADPATVTPQQAAVIEASCTTIMGLRHGEYDYLACRDSLAARATEMAQGQAQLSAYDACRAKGLAPGSGALSTCMLDNEHMVPVAAIAAAPATMALPHDDLKTGESYYSVTHAVQWRREQYACAQLGLVPGGGGFGHCVAALDADLQPTEP